MSGVRFRVSENRGKKSVDRGQMSEDRGLRTEGGLRSGKLEKSAKSRKYCGIRNRLIPGYLNG